MSDVVVPSVGESVQEAVIQRWLKENGQQVEVDEIIAELETDKATVEIIATNRGILTIKKEAGETVAIGEVIATIKATTKQRKKTQQPPTTAPANTATKKPLSPAVRRIVAEQQLDVSKIEGSGKDGRLLKKDLRPAEPVDKQPTTTGERRQAMSLIRRRTAERLVAAKNSTAMLTTFNEINLSQVIDCRQRYRQQFKDNYGVSLGFMGFFCRATTVALQEFPQLNAFVDNTDVVYHDYVNLGIAVAIDRGLVVPVIRDCQQLTIAEIEQQIAVFADKARANKISVDDMSGGTFTISNGGVFGSLLSTPILNPPQSGILGMHKIEKRPIVIDDQVVVAPMMYVALSYDHRLADGKEAVRFLVKIKELLEDPVRLVLGI